MLELYHFPGAICAQKVRIGLAEKGLSWESRITQGALRSTDYLKLNPNGYVPTLVHDGNVVIESRIINEYIDAAFSTPALMPAKPLDRARASLWTKQIDDSLHLSVYILTFTAGFRAAYLDMSPEQLDSALPLTNPIKRQCSFELLKNGFESPIFALAVDRFRKMFADMEEVLAHATWLAGDEYSLADVDFTPYLRRLADLGVWPLVHNEYPSVARWYAAAMARPSYKTAILGWVSVEDEQRTRRMAALAAPRLAAILRTAQGG
jgi:glutathione S-transferase